MPKRSKAAFLRGVGSVLDIGGTTYKRAKRPPIKRGTLAGDQLALARDFNAAMRRIAREQQAAIDRYNAEVRRHNAQLKKQRAAVARAITSAQKQRADDTGKSS